MNLPVELSLAYEMLGYIVFLLDQLEDWKQAILISHLLKELRKKYVKDSPFSVLDKFGLKLCSLDLEEVMLDQPIPLEVVLGHQCFENLDVVNVLQILEVDVIFPLFHEEICPDSMSQRSIRIPYDVLR